MVPPKISTVRKNLSEDVEITESAGKREGRTLKAIIEIIRKDLCSSVDLKWLMINLFVKQ